MFGGEKRVAEIDYCLHILLAGKQRALQHMRGCSGEARDGCQRPAADVPQQRRRTSAQAGQKLHA